jgi:LPS-assembly protein
MRCQPCGAMLGYRTILSSEFWRVARAHGAITMVDPLAGIRRLKRLLSAVLLLTSVAALSRAQTPPAAGQGVAQLEAKQQRREGQISYADGDVTIRYQQLHVTADHVEYNGATYQAVARGHVKFEYDNMEMEADSAEMNLRTNQGHFEHVHGTVHIMRRPNPAVLVSPNPLTFDAASVDRLDEHTYKIHQTKLTVCEPQRPTWLFAANQATLRMDQDVAFVNANFRFFRIPLLYLPYAKLPAGRRDRQSGFLVPEIGNSKTKGVMLGDSYYWAPTDWADATAGAEFLSLRGWSQKGDLRILPSENISLTANYFGLADRLHQGGTSLNVQFKSLLPGGWRAVGDINELSSFVFRLAFAPTFNEAANSEVHSTAFVTNNFDGFSINFAASDYKDFLTSVPQTAVVLRKAPEVRFHSVDQEPWKRWPFYFGIDAFADAAYRSDTLITTPSMVQRSEFAPHVTLPLNMGPWLHITPTFTFRTMRYGAQENDGVVVDDSISRTTEEIQVDLRPASFERTWERSKSKWKHTIEPAIVYRYVTGVNNFGDFLRFDEEDTITDTNEIEYSITQRLFRRAGPGPSDQLISWQVVQKYYFDPTFGGALVAGQRNVFQALDSLTPFAFADGPRTFSPIVSDIKISPQGHFDGEFRIDYDPLRHSITSQEFLMTVRTVGKWQVSFSRYTLNDDPILQPLSDQIRTTVSYGELNRRGWNAAISTSYDLRQGILQNEVVQTSYNGSCCGIALEFRRLSLGTVQTGNEFRAALVIANLGMFGNLHRKESIY